MNNYNTDEYSFLLDFTSWDINFCNLAAAQENISLTQDHILVIEFLRQFYQETNKSPAIRELIRALKEKYDKKIGNSLYLQTLFPVSPAVQPAKLAGLPKPKQCI